MSNVCIDLTSDEEPEVSQIVEKSSGNNKTSRFHEVNKYLNNFRTLNTIQNYRNIESFQLPTIISVQSLAPKKGENYGRNSVFNKQTYQRPTSSLKSIEESIESNILKNLSESTDDENNDLSHNLLKNTPKEDEVSETEVTLLAVTDSKLESNNDISTPENPTPCSSKTMPIQSSAIISFVSENTMLFRQFLGKCVTLEENEKDRHRADQKLRSNHEKASIEYKESETFKNLIKTQLENVNKDNLYECLKVILDELKARRKIDEVSETSTAEDCSEIQELDKKTKFQVIKLSAFLEKLNKKIKVIEETEVDLNNEDESAYVQLHRYRERFTKAHKKLCEITGKSEHAERISKKKIRFNLTKYPEVNKVIERWLNKKKQFPDFSDVMKVLSNANLNLKRDQLHNIAEEAFREIGKLLQNRRKLELWDSLSAYDSQDVDPAQSDSNLNATLIKNRAICQAKEEELIDAYARKQLEGTEGECSTGAVHESKDDAEKKDIIDGVFIEAENVSDKTAVEGCDGNEELAIETDDDVIEEGNLSTRAPLTEMVNAVIIGDEVKTNSNSPSSALKRRQSDDRRAGTKKRICPVPVTDRLPNTPPIIDLNRSKNKALAKPFGSVGQVIELNYCTVRNVYPSMISSIFKDCTNTIHRRTKSFNSAIRQISQKYENSNTCTHSKPSITTDSKKLYKSHGAVGHDASSKENTANGKENQSTSEKEITDTSTTNAGGTSGNDGHGDDDKDKDKKNNSRIENDLIDEAAEEIEDGDFEPDTTVDNSTDDNQDEKCNSLLLDLGNAEGNKIENEETEESVNKLTEIDPIATSELNDGEHIKENSNDRHHDSSSENETDLQEPLPSHTDVSEPPLNIIKVREDLSETIIENNSTKESCEEKEAEPDSQLSGPLKKSYKPAWIDNGEESDNDSPSASNEKIIEPSISCLSEKVVTSTSSLETTKTKKKTKPIKKKISKRPKLNRKVKSSISMLPKNAEELVNNVANNSLVLKKKKTSSSVAKKKVEEESKEDSNDDIEVISESIVKKPLSGDERVKRFLESAKGSASITVTRKRGMSKEAMDAVNQLKKLKNISATRLSSSNGNQSVEISPAGPSRFRQLASPISRPIVDRPQPTYHTLPHQFSPRLRLPSSPLNRLTISNVRGSGNTICRTPNYRARNSLPVISSIHSYNPRSPIVMNFRGNRGAPVRFSTPRGAPQTRRPTLSPASIGRGRGAGRGASRIVPVVVLD